MSPRVLLLSAGLLVVPPGAVAPSQEPSFSFAVLGHIYGQNPLGLHYLLAELLEDLARVEPDFVVLTGDAILGHQPERIQPENAEFWADAEYRAGIVAEWTRLDSALSALGVPVYRVPGNHDIKDIVTRDVFFERYGQVPRAVDVHGSRLLLLSSAWLPGDDDHRRWLFSEGFPIDDTQLAFLDRELGHPAEYRHAFVFVHHKLWWEDEASWWSDVHHRLVRGGVRAVFSGDGAWKFAHLRRDSVDYFQSGIAGRVSVATLRARESSRLWAQMFDNYLLVTVEGDEVSVEVRSLGEVASEHFTPQKWRDVVEFRPPPPGRLDRVIGLIRNPRRLVILLAGAGLAFLIGAIAGYWARGHAHGRRGRGLLSRKRS